MAAEVWPTGRQLTIVAGDVVVIEAMAAAGTEVLATPMSRALASVAYCSEVPTWLVAGHGRRLPEQLFATMIERVADVRAPWDAAAEVVPLGLFTQIIGSSGAVPADTAGALAAECPLAYELLKASPM